MTFSTNESVERQKIHGKTNKVTHAKYTAKIKNWDLSISFEKAKISKTGKIVFTNVAGILSKKSKKIEVKAGLCDLLVAKKQAYLYKNVIIISSEFEVQTENAEINWKKGEIIGKSKVLGHKGNMKFEAQGFYLKGDGEIFLKKPKLIVESKGN
jgi:hypothetical protein